MLYLLLTGRPPARAEASIGASRPGGRRDLVPPGKLRQGIPRERAGNPLSRARPRPGPTTRGRERPAQRPVRIAQTDRAGRPRRPTGRGPLPPRRPLARRPAWSGRLRPWRRCGLSSRAPTRAGGAPSVTGTHNRDAGEPTRERRRRRQRSSFLRRPRPPRQAPLFRHARFCRCRHPSRCRSPRGPVRRGSASPADCFACSGGKPRSAPLRHPAAARPGETGGRKPRARRRTFGAPAARRAVGAAQAQADSPPGRRRSWPSGSRRHPSSFFPSRIASRDPFPARGPGPRRRRRFQRHHRLALARPAIAHGRPRPGAGRP